MGNCGHWVKDKASFRDGGMGARAGGLLGEQEGGSEDSEHPQLFPFLL